MKNKRRKKVKEMEDQQRQDEKRLRTITSPLSSPCEKEIERSKSRYNDDEKRRTLSKTSRGGDERQEERAESRIWSASCFG